MLVVDVGRVADRGYWGEVLTPRPRPPDWRGWCSTAGCVTSPRWRRTDSPCSLPRIALTGATKDKPGTVGAPVRVGGVQVALGDWVVADVDGVAFVRGDEVQDVLAAGRERESKEAGFFEALRGGSTTVGLLGLDASLVRQGDAG